MENFLPNFFTHNFFSFFPLLKKKEEGTYMSQNMSTVQTQRIHRFGRETLIPMLNDPSIPIARIGGQDSQLRLDIDTESFQNSHLTRIGTKGVGYKTFSNYMSKLGYSIISKPGQKKKWSFVGNVRFPSIRCVLSSIPPQEAAAEVTSLSAAEAVIASASEPPRKRIQQKLATSPCKKSTNNGDILVNQFEVVIDDDVAQRYLNNQIEAVLENLNLEKIQELISVLTCVHKDIKSKIAEMKKMHSSMLNILMNYNAITSHLFSNSIQRSNEEEQLLIQLGEQVENMYLRNLNQLKVEYVAHLQVLEKQTECQHTSETINYQKQDNAKLFKQYKKRKRELNMYEEENNNIARNLPKPRTENDFQKTLMLSMTSR